MIIKFLPNRFMNTRGTAKKILVLNAGSSSLKFALFNKDKNLTEVYRGQFDNRGKPIKNFEQAVKNAVSELKKNRLLKDISEIISVGHRVVHGGELYTKPMVITKGVINQINNLSTLAPLHNPINLACIRAAQKMVPHATHVAVFDTAFHHTMPDHAYLYALPYSLYKKYGIRRYGFHGTSHSYVFDQAQKKLGKKKTQRTITCHLGNGCSMAAILNGRVIDTSMGFTPLEGLPMGTRSGDMDPAIVFFLMNQEESKDTAQNLRSKKNLLSKDVETLLQKKSGLLGVSEFSSDVRDLWAAYSAGASSKNKKYVAASRTLKLFAYRIAKYVGAYMVALGGLDCIVFTGGIGENAWYLRKWVMAYLKGIASPTVLVMNTDEEKKIAQEIYKF